MGCLFALLGGIFPRFALLILWIARPASARGTSRRSAAAWGIGILSGVG